MDGQTEEWTDGRMDRPTDGPTNGPTGGWTDRQMERRTNGRTEGLTEFVRLIPRFVIAVFHIISSSEYSFLCSFLSFALH